MKLDIIRRTTNQSLRATKEAMIQKKIPTVMRMLMRKMRKTIGKVTMRKVEEIITKEAKNPRKLEPSEPIYTHDLIQD